MQTVKRNPIKHIAVRHILNCAFSGDGNNISKEHIRRNCTVRHTLPFWQRIVQIKTLSLYTSGSHVAEQSMFKAVQRSFPIVRFWIFQNRLIVRCTHHVPYFTVLMVNHFIKPVTLSIVKIIVVRRVVNRQYLSSLIKLCKYPPFLVRSIAPR